MPTEQRKLIVEGLTKYFEELGSTPELFITFKDGNGEHWFQCADDLVLNFDFPFGEVPGSEFEDTYLSPVKPIELIDRQADVFATYKVASSDAETVAQLIDSVFHNLYELPADYVITWELIY